MPMHAAPTFVVVPSSLHLPSFGSRTKCSLLQAGRASFWAAPASLAGWSDELLLHRRQPQIRTATTHRIRMLIFSFGNARTGSFENLLAGVGLVETLLGLCLQLDRVPHDASVRPNQGVDCSKIRVHAGDHGRRTRHF